jgi:hypothetical protein
LLMLLGCSGLHRKPSAASVLVCFTLAACAPAVELPVPVYVPPSMPTEAAAAKGIKKATADEKLTGPIERSDLRETEHGPGRFVVCIRGVDAKYRRMRAYAVFFDNDDYKGARISVMIDDCEKQSYRPVPFEASPKESGESSLKEPGH